MSGWGAGFGSGYGGESLVPFVPDVDGVLPEIPPGLLDTVDTATALLWKQFEGQPNWLDLLTVIGDAFEDVNAQQYDIHNYRYLTTAFGVALEEVGALVGLSRGSLSDDGQYQKAIRVEAATLFASGTRPEILELARALFPTVPPIRLIDFYPGSWDLRIRNLSQSDLDLLQVIFEDVPCSGVRGFVATWVDGNAGGWDWDGLTDPGALGYWAWDNPGDADPERSHWIHERVIGD